ncbi:aminotransferase class V-fold PLP-dependent enzyme [Chryseolinea lacunae]|uniref:phosphoserine transaminase n=1 Tax=Chryseolinea lacunae TaxID=2801331 RepID=A0ABS1KY86_9BACT|nr:aminotransferase class V-fold PLP-dependent enzyme [Chryseolinea lacunae]MBL0744405.1 aminotransferase class V-fold PLP-dependent enzyme [Chryseolinea lacunae]
MNPTVNFTPGPSQLYFTVEDHVRTAFREGVPSLSHRTKKFESYYQSTVEGLRALLNIPAGYHLYFTGSATEIWERVVENLVEEKSFHLVNGSFSKRFFEVSQQLQRKADKLEVANGQGFDASFRATEGTELIALTHNETSTGVMLPLEFFKTVRANHPDALLAVDAVSSLPFPDFDFNLLDSVFFSVQKGFGLPAGLGVWLVNDKCVAKAEQLLAKGKSIGSYHTIPSLHTHALKNQTPETPNVLAIYLLSKVVEDMNRKGIQAIRKETEYKAALLYNTLNQHSVLNPFVKDKAFQSKTVVVADTGEHTERITKLLLEKGMQPGDGYGPSKKTQLRFANFPTHAKEHFEALVDTLEAYKP